MLRVSPAMIEAVKIIEPTRFADARGFFSETWSRKAFLSAGIALDFVQDNHSSSAMAGTLRGLHFQAPPYAQAKLVRVTRGRILDVAVDIRRGSPTFGRHVAIELSAANWRQLLVPVGFAHGFCTLEADTEVLYKVTADYSPENDFGVAYDDPSLNIAWPFDRSELTLSDKDSRHPQLADLPAFFE